MDSCPNSLQPSAPHSHEPGDPSITSRCPACGHAVEIHPIEPGITDEVWRYVLHDADGNTLVMQSRGNVPWNERVIDPDEV